MAIIEKGLIHMLGKLNIESTFYGENGCVVNNDPKLAKSLIITNKQMGGCGVITIGKLPQKTHITLRWVLGKITKRQNEIKADADRLDSFNFLIRYIYSFLGFDDLRGVKATNMGLSIENVNSSEHKMFRKFLDEHLEKNKIKHSTKKSKNKKFTQYSIKKSSFNMTELKKSLS